MDRGQRASLRRIVLVGLAAGALALSTASRVGASGTDGVVAAAVRGAGASWGQAAQKAEEDAAGDEQKKPAPKIDAEAAKALLAETTPEARARVLDAHPELLSKEGVIAVLREAQTAVNTGQHELALRGCEAADEITTRGKLDATVQAICGMMRGALLGKMDRREEAVEALKKTLPLARESKNVAFEGMVLCDLARQHEALGQVDEAKAAYEEALQLARRSKAMAKLEGEVLGKLGGLEQKLGHIDKALELMEQALGIARREKDRTTEASTLLNIGSLWGDRGDTARALGYHEEALAIYRDANNRMGTVSALNSCAIDNKNLGRYRRALELYQEALERAQAIKARSTIATLQDNIGTVLRLIGRWNEAMKLHNAALVVHRELKSPAGEAMVLNHLGIAARVQGDTELALERFDEGLKIAVALRSPSQTATLLANKANALSDGGRYDEAIASYETSLEIYRRLGDRRGIAANLMNLSNLYKHMGGHRLLQAAREEALEMARATRDPSLEASALALLGKALSGQGKHEEGAALLEQALGLMPEDSAERASIHVDLALYLVGRDDTRGAVSHAKRAEQIAEGTSQPQMHAASLLILSMAQLPQADAPSVTAPPNLEAALEAALKACRVTQATETDELLSFAHYLAGKSYAALGDQASKLAEYLAAYEALERQQSRGGAPAERETFPLSHVRLLRQLALHYAGDDDARNGFKFAERGKAQMMLEAMAGQELRMAAAQLPPELASRHRKALRQLGELGTVLRRELARRGKGADEELIEELRLKREQAEMELAKVKMALQQRSPAFAALRYPETPDAEAAIGSIPPDAALVEYVVTSSSAAVFVLTQRGISVRRLEGGTPELGRKVALFRKAVERLKAPDGEGQKRLWEQARELYEVLLEPELKALSPEVKRLIIVPDGPLHILPFGALVVSVEGGGRAGARYLCQERAISYAPSLTVLQELGTRKRPPERPNTIVALCDPAYGGDAGAAPEALRGSIGLQERAGWAPLRASAQEGAAIESLWGERAVVLSEAEATEERAKVAAADARCLHFATHAFLDRSSPLYSAIVLTPQEEGEDGYLQVYEICELDLRGCLVVLSACSTALGHERAGEGLMGLTRGFFLAGAPAVVASLWNVDDEATAVMGAELHGRLKAGQPAAEALRDAQRAMIEGTHDAKKDAERYALPYYWAAFGAYGDPAATVGD